MARSSLTHTPPIRRHRQAVKPDYEQLEAAVALTQEGRHEESLYKVLAHLFPTVTLPDLSVEAFGFTQGSSRVYVRLENGEFRIFTPLVRLPTGGSAIAALRHVLTQISASGQLYQPRLHGDDIHLEFRDELERLHPAKVIEVLRRMPEEADRNDDWLIGQFGALPLERESVLALSEDEFVKAEAFWRTHWKDVDALLQEAQRKRSRFFLNELTAFVGNRLEFVLPLCGYLSVRISEAASTFNDSDVDPHKREASLAKCTKDMLAVSPEDLQKSLGHAEYALSRFTEATPALLTSYLGPGRYTQTIDEHRTSGKSLDAALALIGTYYYLLAHYAWPEEVEARFTEGLVLTSDRPWREVANVLWEQSREIVDMYGSDDDEGDEDDEDGDDEDDE